MSFASPPLRDWIATDLDNTLFSRRWAGPGAVPGTWSGRVGGEGDAARAPSSWVHPETHRLLAALSRAAVLVPVTARDLESFARVDVAGLDLRGPAVVANGAFVLGPDGQPDPQWEELMTGLLTPWAGRLEAICKSLLARSLSEIRPRLVDGPRSLPAYLVAKAPDGWWQSPAGVELFSGVRADCGDGCHVSVLGNELQILPPGLGKAPATRFVQERHFAGQPPLLCLGDMPADLGFMRLGGLLAVPRGSELEGQWIG